MISRVINCVRHASKQHRNLCFPGSLARCAHRAPSSGPPRGLTLLALRRPAPGLPSNTAQGHGTIPPLENVPRNNLPPPKLFREASKIQISMILIRFSNAFEKIFRGTIWPPKLFRGTFKLFRGPWNCPAEHFGGQIVPRSGLSFKGPKLLRATGGA